MFFLIALENLKILVFCFVYVSVLTLMTISKVFKY